MNKHRCIVVILLLFYCASSLVCLPLGSSYYGGESPDYLVVTGDNGKLYTYIRGIEKTYEGILRITKVDGLSFLMIGDRSPQYLFLFSTDFALLQDTHNGDCTFLTARMGKGIETIQKPKISQSSSSLTENSITYGPDNLSRAVFSGTPFVPARNEGWRNCSLHLEWDKYAVGAKNILIISSGFVDINRPYLYLQNSRAKTITVLLDGKPGKYTFRVEDTPNPQVLQLPKAFITADISFSSVYQGNKWDDLCINFIWAGNSGTADIRTKLFPQ